MSGVAPGESGFAVKLRGLTAHFLQFMTHFLERLPEENMLSPNLQVKWGNYVIYITTMEAAEVKRVFVTIL